MPLNYEINAQLRLRGASGFQRSMGRLSRRVGTIAERFRSAGGAASGLFRTLASVGAGYLGFHAIVGGIRNAVGGMVEFQRHIEQAHIGLQSVIAAVDDIPFEQARVAAGAVFNELRQDAIRSVATTAEMFDIFVNIAGPIRNAGRSLADVRMITSQTVSAATALGIPLQQASSDILRMVSGVAGMRLPLFRMLRSTGAIAEDAREWNQNLTTSERIDRLTDALGRFDDAATAYSTSFSGVTSTFTDIMQLMTSAFAKPVFAQVTRFLANINQRLIENQAAIETALEGVGERVGNVLGSVFDFIFRNLDNVIASWDTISARMEEVATTLRTHSGELQALAAAMAGLATMKMALGPLLGAISGMLSVVEGVGAIGGGGAAAGAAGEGGTAAAAGFGAALGPLAIVLLAVAGIISFVVEYWEQLLEVFMPLLPILQAIWADFQIIGVQLWEVLRPILKLVGTTIFVMFIGGLMALLVILRVVAFVLAHVITWLASLANLIEQYIIDPFISAVLQIARAIARFLGTTLGIDPTKTGGAARGGPVAPGAARTPEETVGDVMEAVPGERPQQVNNFHRGSVSIRQDFREADPDRVLVRILSDIDSQAERRTQSGFAPALTR